MSDWMSWFTPVSAGVPRTGELAGGEYWGDGPCRPGGVVAEVEAGDGEPFVNREVGRGGFEPGLDERDADGVGQVVALRVAFLGLVRVRGPRRVGLPRATLPR